MPAFHIGCIETMGVPIYCMRHAEGENNVGTAEDPVPRFNTVNPNAVPLTAKGREQTQLCDLTPLYGRQILAMSSPFLRVMETAFSVIMRLKKDGGCNVQVSIAESLREIRFETQEREPFDLEKVLSYNRRVRQDYESDRMDFGTVDAHNTRINMLQCDLRKWIRRCKEEGRVLVVFSHFHIIQYLQNILYGALPFADRIVPLCSLKLTDSARVPSYWILPPEADVAHFMFDLPDNCDAKAIIASLIEPLPGPCKLDAQILQYDDELQVPGSQVLPF